MKRESQSFKISWIKDVYRRLITFPWSFKSPNNSVLSLTTIYCFILLIHDTSFKNFSSCHSIQCQSLLLVVVLVCLSSFWSRSQRTQGRLSSLLISVTVYSQTGSWACGEDSHSFDIKHSKIPVKYISSLDDHVYTSLCYTLCMWCKWFIELLI